MIALNVNGQRREVDVPPDMPILWVLRNGRVEQSNFHDYLLLRMNQVPPIEVHLIKSGEEPGGIGEAGVTSALPALRNAIYAATGVALRRMPIDSSLLAKASA